MVIDDYDTSTSSNQAGSSTVPGFHQNVQVDYVMLSDELKQVKNPRAKFIYYIAYIFQVIFYSYINKQ